MENKNLYKIIIQKEELSKDEIDKFFIDMVCKPNEESKQEKIEEAAENYSKKSSASVFQENHKIDFINGAKWQQEQDKNKYSEEDVLELFTKFKEDFSLYRNVQILDTEFYKWFKKYKK